MSRSTIIDDLFFMNYMWKRDGRVQSINKTQVKNLQGRLDRFLNDDIISIYNHGLYGDGSLDIGYNVQTNILLSKFLDIGNGKLSFCGIEVCIQSIQNANLYFHSCTEEEANNILNLCLEFIIDDYPSNIKKTQEYIVFYDEIKIFREIYQTKEQILMNFDTVTKRHGYNPIDKYFTTICGAFSYVMEVYPIDTTRINSSLKEDFPLNRNIGYKILFPGLSSMKFGDKIILYNITISLGENNIDYDYDYHDDITDNHDNICHLYLNENHKVIFDISADTIVPDKIWINTGLPNVTFDNAKLFLGDKFNVYLSALISDPDHSIKIWNDQLEKYLDKAHEIAKSIEQNPWKIYQHEFIPITEPNMCYGKYHIRTQTGLKHDRFVQFYHCTLMYNIPKDLFRLLCHYWLEAEYTDAYIRLNNYLVNQESFPPFGADLL